MRAISRFMFLGTLITTLAACSGAKIYNLQFAQNYQHLALMAEHGGRQMKLEVLGGPTEPDPVLLTQSVAKAMSGSNVGRPITFTPTPTNPADAPSSIVMLLDPAPDALGRQVCAGTAPRADTQAPRSAIIAYCKRGLELSSIWIELPEDGTVGSGPFNKALALATRQLLPVRSPFDTNGNCRVDC